MAEAFGVDKVLDLIKIHSWGLRLTFV